MALEDALVADGLWPSAVADIIAGYGTPYADAGGTVNAITWSLPNFYSGIVDGDMIGVGTIGSNTGAATIKVQIGNTVFPAQAIVKYINGVAVAVGAGDLQGQVILSRDGPNSRWILLTPANTAASTISGTLLADNSPAGALGEYLFTTAATPGVSLTTATAANVVSLALTPGDWDVVGICDFLSAATTSVTGYSAGITVTTAVLPGQAAAGGVGPDALATCIQPATVPGAGVNQLDVCPVRVSIAAATTIYLVASATFSVSTLSAFGTLRARRVR